uniref:Uncharacterized protein n=1 Tax=Myoviridae sp. ctNQV2 TaxID=2827683 RepID=A0A8S5RZY7_9CAUD|nr:MAG TPA: hypothetical protein [Myoviridae sp. ctNQV2]
MCWRLYSIMLLIPLFPFLYYKDRGNFFPHQII